MLCRLCISDCDESSVELLDSGGKSTTVYNVVAKYFEKEINMTKVKSEFDTAQYAESINLKSQVICVNCWRRIDDFHKWQEEVVIQQEERLKQLQLPYQRDMVECVKLEMEMDVNNVDIFANSFADDICDNDEFLNEATEDPVAVCETQHEGPPNNFLFVDQVMDDNCSNDSAYDDVPLLRRKKLAISTTPVAVINQQTGADTLAAKRECRLCLQGGDKVRRKTRFYCTACMNPVCQQHSKVSYTCFACLPLNP